jgi:hypothetical protein
MLHMKYWARIQYTEADKALMWERWRPGESLHAIARRFERNHSAIGGMLSRTGGIRPLCCGERRRRCRCGSIATTACQRGEPAQPNQSGPRRLIQCKELRKKRKCGLHSHQSCNHSEQRDHGRAPDQCALLARKCFDLCA